MRIVPVHLCMHVYIQYIRTYTAYRWIRMYSICARRYMRVRIRMHKRTHWEAEKFCTKEGRKKKKRRKKEKPHLGGIARFYRGEWEEGEGVVAGWSWSRFPSIGGNRSREMLKRFPSLSFEFFCELKNFSFVAWFRWGLVGRLRTCTHLSSSSSSSFTYSFPLFLFLSSLLGLIDDLAQSTRPPNHV